MDYSIFSRFRGFQLFAGFSGGADSTALLLAASRAAQEYDFALTAVHFNHHLRGAESDNEAREAEKFARQLGVKFILIDLDIPPGGNLEARAREARLATWQELCAGYENAAVLLGHHQDDRIENLFLRIGRGSNASGLTGMQKFSEVNKVKFIRPLLDLSREQIEEFLLENGISSWAVDSSNLSCDYSRNALRNKILPELFRLYSGGRKAVAATLANLECDAAFLDKMAMERYQGEPERFKVAFWQRQERALSVRMLRLLCRELFAVDMPLARAATERFEAMVTAGNDGICLLDECRKMRFCAGVIYPLSEVPGTVQWRWREKSDISWGKWLFTVKKIDELPEDCPLCAACFDAETLPDVLEIGTAVTGEKMLPFGRKKMVKVKELRIKRKIPAFPANPLFRDGQKRVIWMPGIRHSGEYPVSSGGSIVMFCGEKTEDFN